VKPPAIVGLALVAFLVGGLVCRGDKGGEAAQRRADSLAVVMDSARAQDVLRLAARRADSQRLASMNRENQRLASAGQAAQHRADSLAGLVLDTASVVARPLYDATVQEFRGLVQVREAERDSARAESALWQRSAFAADSSRQRWAALAVGYRTQLEQALKRSKWGCYGGIGASLGYGFVGDRAGVGTVAGLSVTCGKRL